MLLRIKEAAVILACSPKQVRKIIDRGEIPVVRLGKTARSDRIDEPDLYEYIHNTKQRIKRTVSTSELSTGKVPFRSEVNALDELLDRIRAEKKQKNK